MDIKEIKIGDFVIVESDSNDNYKVIQKLSPQEFKSVKEADENLYEMNYHFRRANEILLNYEEYHKVLKTHLEKLGHKDTNPEYGEIALIDVNRVFNNIISSFRQQSHQAQKY